ncbi:M48 family metallopeptidase [Desulforhopalus sp. IMCC35007]|uniref:M48 family metallopeptidase n=1 Tax=Desulforhopalus sp. IMCC35007 TaxID=2569543 RepID=UPI0010AEB9C9|nr:M48 family metallopeptidase [Desulforhopalus sp. IMCC35007]TKB08047.1 M48 family metallopeptidase [Desulforhopalus sp. IMCC35007]
MNIWLIIVLAIIIFSFIFETSLSLLNIKALSPDLPKEFETVYNHAEYQKSQQYTKNLTIFSIIENTWSTLLIVTFILCGGFNWIDKLARQCGYGEIITGLIFTAILIFLSFLSTLPFSIYSTFVIETKFGFNTTTPKTFVLDILKGALLAIILGGPLLALIFWFFQATGVYAWVYCWIGVVAFSIGIQFIAPVVIMPLFNTFTPLEPGELKDKILGYSEQEKFKLNGIFTMDGSKRSTKLNAFFTGFGKFRKIVFFDTLTKELSPDEIVAVLAHEMGHFKLKHIIKMMGLSIIQTGFMFFLLSLFLTMPEVSQAFRLEQPSIYASLVFFGFLYSPINLFISIAANILSRKHEFEADAYASATTGQSSQLITSLKKLSRANLSNLTPHPLYVFFHYSHPPLLQRINRLSPGVTS